MNYLFSPMTKGFRTYAFELITLVTWTQTLFSIELQRFTPSPVDVQRADSRRNLILPLVNDTTSDVMVTVNRPLPHEML